MNGYMRITNGDTMVMNSGKGIMNGIMSNDIGIINGHMG